MKQILCKKCDLLREATQTNCTCFKLDKRREAKFSDRTRPHTVIVKDFYLLEFGVDYIKATIRGDVLDGKAEGKSLLSSYYWGKGDMDDPSFEQAQQLLLSIYSHYWRYDTPIIVCHNLWDVGVNYEMISTKHPLHIKKTKLLKDMEDSTPRDKHPSCLLYIS